MVRFYGEERARVGRYFDIVLVVESSSNVICET